MFNFVDLLLKPERIAYVVEGKDLDAFMRLARRFMLDNMKFSIMKMQGHEVWVLEIDMPVEMRRGFGIAVADNGLGKIYDLNAPDDGEETK